MFKASTARTASSIMPAMRIQSRKADTASNTTSVACPRQFCLYLGAEHIPAAAHGFYEFRNLRIGFDFPPEPADLHIDAPVDDCNSRPRVRSRS